LMHDHTLLSTTVHSARKSLVMSQPSDSFNLCKTHTKIVDTAKCGYYTRSKMKQGGVISDDSLFF